MKRSLYFLTVLLTAACPAFSAVPTLSIDTHETIQKAEEIFKAHIEFKSFNREVAKRTFLNFIEEIDPLKIYLIKPEIEPYLEPSDGLLDLTIAEYKREQFTQFEAIYAVMLNAIERRNSIEAKIDGRSLPKHVKARDVHEAGWANSEADLCQKLLNVRSLQADAAKKLDSEEKNALFFQRVAKRRLNHEKELIGTSRTERNSKINVFVLKSLSGALDSHTMYFTPGEAKQFLIQVQQSLCGIGAQLRDDLNGFSIVQVIEGGPSHKEGSLRSGDRIIAVNNDAIVGMDISDAVELIRGPKGTSVILTVIRGEAEENPKTFDVEIIRDEVVIQESRYEARSIPFGHGHIGHISLHSFYQDPKSSSTEDLRRSIDQLKAQGPLFGIILDLRSNSGGLLSQAIGVTGLFIKKGVVASINDYSGRQQRLRNLSHIRAFDGPLIVLTNRGSASASEIVAMALSDYGRALIVGDERTYGKGSYQTFTLESANVDLINPQGEYKVTRGRYHSVGGHTPQKKGVEAHLKIPGIYSEMKIGEMYSKYPLEPDQIPSLFEDDLKDVNSLQRIRLKKIIGNDIQKRSTELKSITPLLAKHSNSRIKSNQNYNEFLASLKSLDFYELDFEKIGQNDLQLEESINVCKELIVLEAIKRSSSPN